jgi:hypothetical protein
MSRRVVPWLLLAVVLVLAGVLTVVGFAGAPPSADLVVGNALARTASASNYTAVLVTSVSTTQLPSSHRGEGSRSPELILSALIRFSEGTGYSIHTTGLLAGRLTGAEWDAQMNDLFSRVARTGPWTGVGDGLYTVPRSVKGIGLNGRFGLPSAQLPNGSSGGGSFSTQITFYPSSLSPLPPRSVTVRNDYVTRIVLSRETAVDLPRFDLPRFIRLHARSMVFSSQMSLDFTEINGWIVSH